MASYHWHMQIIGRKGGRSAIRAAAYRAGQDLLDERTGLLHAFGQRRGVYHTEIFLPPLTHSRLGDRQTLWNEVERAERRVDAQLARELNVALPCELTREQQYGLLRTYVTEQFVAHGMIADVAIHVPRPGRGEDERNVHAHVMLTLRQGTPIGLHTVKTRAWNSPELLVHWRIAWADYANRELERAGSVARIDARSLSDQREAALAEGDEARAQTLAREPELHMGPNAVAMARKARREQKQINGSPETCAIPDKVADNAERIDRNAHRAWARHARAQAAEVRWAERALFGPELTAIRKDGSVLSYAQLVAKHDRPPPTGRVGHIIDGMRNTEITAEALKVLRGINHSLAMPDISLADLLTDTAYVRTPFRVTPKDIAFAFYKMGLLSLERLSTTLELIESEQALRQASDRKASFWSRLTPRHRGHAYRHEQARTRRRRNANDPTDP